MSKSYDLEIIKATRAILVADNVDPSPPTQLSIHSCVADRIYQGDVPLQKVTIPHITLSTDLGPGDDDLPVEHGELRVKVWYKQSAQNARALCRRCSTRVAGLLDRQPAAFNTANSAIIVRLCDKASHLYLTEPERKMYYGSLVFDVTYRRIIGE